MITKLYIDNGFRHFNRTIEFDKGLTSITGPNESGKSLIVEFIRYALFGTPALRGPAEDYKKLHVELWFRLRGHEYHVVRKGTKVELHEDDTPLASGTRPVNQAIIEKLGYDMAVFDVANSCNQGAIDALSKMKPTERKAMVDRTIGLDVLDDTIKFCGEQALLAKREVETLERSLVAPTFPVAPDNYVESAGLTIALSEARKLLQKRNQLQGWLNATPAAPDEPMLCSVRETTSELEAYQRTVKLAQTQKADLENRIKNIRLPKYPTDFLDQQAEQWVAYGLWTQKKRFLDQGHLCCPSCKHEWPIAAEQLQAFTNVVEVDKPQISEATIKEERSLAGQQKHLDDLIEELHTFSVPADRTVDLHQRRQYEASVTQYEAAKRAYDAYQSEYATKKAEFDNTAGAETALMVLEEAYQEALTYEREQQAAERAKKAYDAAVEAVGVVRERADEFAEAKRRTLDLKVQVKTHLLPSLNKVASMLLNQMTGGQRYLVEVDEDFEIRIDGQRLVTLSGSGTAVANLAIRIALGQILTNKVFSVFFADEVDAAMDNDRAGYTAQALRRLTDLIGQVILITHKRPETDHSIELN